jgi:DNA-binding FadR family transcriptional regulator
MLQPLIRRRKLYEEVVARLEALIHEGRYRPGDHLPSERALQKMGLASINSGERARVTRPTPQVVLESIAGSARLLLSEPNGVRHFQEVRSFFEIGLGRYAAQHATADDIAELRRALEVNRLAIGNPRRFEETDVAFHYVLALIPRNPIFTALHAAIAAWLTEQRSITLTYPGQSEVAYQAHAQIYAAIAARDPDRAERVTREHLDQVVNLYWQIAGGTQAEPDHNHESKAGNVETFPKAHRRKR